MDYEPQVSGFQFLIPSKNNIDGWTKCWTPPPLFPWCGGLTSKAQKCESIFYSLTTFRHSFSNVEMFASIVLGCSIKAKQYRCRRLKAYGIYTVSGLFSSKFHRKFHRCKLLFLSNRRDSNPLLPWDLRRHPHLAPFLKPAYSKRALSPRR